MVILRVSSELMQLVAVGAHRAKTLGVVSEAIKRRKNGRNIWLGLFGIGLEFLKLPILGFD